MVNEKAMRIFSLARSRKMPHETNPVSLNHTQKMHIFLPILLLLSSTTALHSSSLAPPLHLPHLLKRLPQNDVASPQEYFEISKPLPSDNSPPSCTLPILSHDFGNTIGLPPITANYSAPSNCTWTRVTLDINVSSQGEQYDRIAGVWLDGVELIRTSTAEPNANGIFWNVRKDVTRYSSLLAKEDLTLSVMLENIVNELYTGVYKVNITFFYYDIDAAVDHPVLLSLPSDKALFNLYDKPADFIVPISSTGEDDGYWFRIQKGSETRSVGIQIPPNAYKAVIEIYVSFHGNDEFWYSNPPDSYIEMNKLNTGRGHGAYREVMLTIDGKLVGSVVPFPVIFTGGINPLFWEPIVSIGAFNLPSYDFDLTPFLGLILDENVHYFGLGVAESIPFWLVDANLHIWLDDSVSDVQAGSHEYKVPHFSTDREFEFEGLDGEFEIEVKRKSEFIGWVNSTAGNFTTNITQEMEFKNEIEFEKDGNRKKVEQKVKELSIVTILSANGTVISLSRVNREYPLKITSETVAGFAAGTYLMNNKLENSVKVKKIVGNSTSELSNSQECSGWMFVQDHDVVSGAANTQQNYKLKDGSECYSRKVAASNGKILNDNFSSLCQSSF